MSDDDPIDPPEPTNFKAYLGDGAYVDMGNFSTEVVLTTEDGISVQNRVVLGPHEIDALLRWLKDRRIIK